MTSGGFRTQHLAIVGLGLMGGSLALALRDCAKVITGIDSDPATRDFALQNKIIDHATADLKAGVKDADTVLLCAPVRTGGLRPGLCSPGKSDSSGPEAIEYSGGRERACEAA